MRLVTLHPGPRVSGEKNIRRQPVALQAGVGPREGGLCPPGGGPRGREAVFHAAAVSPKPRLHVRPPPHPLLPKLSSSFLSAASPRGSALAWPAEALATAAGCTERWSAVHTGRLRRSGARGCGASFLGPGSVRPHSPRVCFSLPLTAVPSWPPGPGASCPLCPVCSFPWPPHPHPPAGPRSGLCLAWPPPCTQLPCRKPLPDTPSQ